MRIGIDATALPSQPVGAGTYMVQLIRALAEQETPHELVIFAYPHGHAEVGVPARPGFEWVMLPGKSPARRLVWEQVGFPGVVQQSRVDLLHSLHYTRPLRLACPSVVTFHDMTFFLFPHLHTRAKRLFFPSAIRFSARRASALIAVSESTRQDAIRLLKIPSEKITATPLGVSADFRPVTEPGLRASVRQRYDLPDHFILYTGLVEPRKNLPLLLRVFRRLRDAGCATHLVIVGRFGWMYTEVLRQVEESGLNEWVHFTGYLPAQDLPIVYNLADVFVYPTIYEGFGLPPLEAMACGTPVVTTAVSSLPEHIGDAGLLVPPQDEEALTQAIQNVLTDQTLQQRLSAMGLTQAAKFTWKRTAQQTLEVYARVLKTDLPT